MLTQGQTYVLGDGLLARVHAIVNSFANDDQIGTYRKVLDDVVVEAVSVHTELAEPWRGPDGVAEHEIMHIPVNQLRFTHDAIDSRLHFRNQLSLFKFFDELQREAIKPEELEPLDVCVHHGCAFNISNRRLFVLQMYQAVHRDRVVHATCVLRQKSWNNYEVNKALATKNTRKPIDAHTAGGLQESLHRKRPIFDSGKTAPMLLEEFLIGSKYEWFPIHVRLRESQHDNDAHSLTVASRSTR